MIGVPGTAHRLFGALREEGISVILISQGSSEHSICCAIPQEQAERAAARRAPGLRARAAGRPDPERRRRPGPAHPRGGRRRHGRHARRRRRRCSTRSAPPASTCARSRRARPSATSPWWSTASMPRARCARCTPGFYLSPHTHLDRRDRPGHGGPRAARSARLAERAAARAVQARPARARHHRLASACCSPTPACRCDDWRDAVRASAARRRPRALRRARARRLSAAHGASSTARRAPRSPRTIADWLARRHPHRDAEQEGQQRPLAYYRRLHEARRAGGAHYLYEATVGAGLPVVQTLRDLRETGDEISSIEGIFSGTLAYLFNVYDGRRRFSEHRARRAAARLHRARSARRPLRHGRRAQAHHPRPRDGPDARARRTCRWRAWCRPASQRARSRSSWRSCRSYDARDARSASTAARGARQGAALRRAAHRRRARRPSACVELDAHARLRQHRAHRQRRALRHAPLLRQSAHRAGPGRGAGSDRRRRVRRPAARWRPTSERACERRRHAERATAFAPASVGNVAIGFDILGFCGRCARRPRHGERARRARASSITRDHAASPAICRSSRSDNTAGRALLAHAARRCSPDFGFEHRDRQGHSARLGPRRLGGLRRRRRWSRPMRCCRSRCSKLELLKFAMQGEAVASGSLHVDNIAPSLFGGLVLTVGIDHPRVKQIPVPAGVRAVHRASAHVPVDDAGARHPQAHASSCRTSSGRRPISPASSPAATRTIST